MNHGQMINDSICVFNSHTEGSLEPCFYVQKVYVKYNCGQVSMEPCYTQAAVGDCNVSGTLLLYTESGVTVMSLEPCCYIQEVG